MLHTWGICQFESLKTKLHLYFPIMTPAFNLRSHIWSNIMLAIWMKYVNDCFDSVSECKYIHTWSQKYIQTDASICMEPLAEAWVQPTMNILQSGVRLCHEIDVQSDSDSNTWNKFSIPRVMRTIILWRWNCDVVIYEAQFHHRIAKCRYIGSWRTQFPTLVWNTI